MSSDLRVLQTELLICGAGVGGLTAAAYAAEQGADVLLVEKTKHASPMRDEVGAIGSAIQQREGVQIDVDELVRQMAMYGSGYADQKLHRLWARESGAMIDWLTAIVESYGGYVSYQGGYAFEVKSNSFSKVPTGHRLYWEGEKKGAAAMLDYAQQRGAKVMYQTKLDELLVEEGVVIGALLTDVATGEQIKALASKGVIVATGGYAGNPDMLAELQPHTMDTAAMVCVGPAIAGEGIKACLRAGAVMDVEHTSMVFDRCSIMTDETPATVRRPGRPIELIAQPFLRVDLNGRRFMNESAPYDYAVHRAQTLPGKCYAVVFDGSYKEDTARFEMTACSRVHPFPNGAPVAHPIEEMEAKLAKLVEDGFFVKADTVEDLAAGLGIPVDAFVATVERYNELCDKGVDEDFGKEAYRLSPLRKAPFYGSRACGFVLCTMDGICIDESMNALDGNASAIPGLYVVGCDSGSYFANTYMNLITGCCAGRTMTFALRAVKCALGLA